MSRENEIWVADFEFNGADGGDNPHPICFCAVELNSNKHIRIWLEGIENPKAPIDFNDPAITYIAFYSTAEFSCHLQLGWAIPKNIIDLFCEWRVLTNDGVRHEHGYNGLLNACNRFGITTIDQKYKDRMRDRVLRGAPFSEDEKQEILDYCDTDIFETAALFKAMRPTIDDWARALFRGQYMSIIAQIEHAGVPIDTETLVLMRENWDTLKLELIKEISKDFDFFKGLTFKTRAFENYLYSHSMAWPRTENGNLKLDDDTWKSMTLTSHFPHPLDLICC